jgi:hypothetical protein
MSRTKLHHALAAGLALAACTAPVQPEPLDTGSQSLTRAERAAPLARADLELATPALDVRVPDDRLEQVRWPWPPIVDWSPAPEPEPTPPVTTQVELCSKTALWISPSRGVGCPFIEGTGLGRWEPRSVFGDDAPPLLASVCAYDWLSDDSDAPPELEVLTEQLRRYQGEPPELDCQVMNSLAPDEARLDDALWRSMRDTAHQQAGRGRGAPRFQSPTLVAIIDSAARPYEESSERDTYGHGRIIGRFVDDLTRFKDGGESLAVIHNELALALDHKGQRNDTHGGYFGTREDLALAIHRAVGLYVKRLADDPKNAPQRLVLNLSVGWDPSHGGDVDHPEQLSPASRTVYNALARAACLGAVTIAAAGNAHGSSDTGAVLPAAWQRLPAPSKDECARLTGYREDRLAAQHLPPSSVSDRSMPLVVAGSGLDPYDRPLSTTRIGGEPRLVAYGMSFVTDDVGDARGEHTSIQTGSSFAAAVLSSALAGVWAVAPQLTPREALEVVYKSGIPLGRSATMPLLGALDEQHRVSVCEAIAKAGCWTTGCDPDLVCDTVGAGGGGSQWTPDMFERSADAVLGSAPDALPTLPSALTKPWTCGQPLDEGCGRCSVLRVSRLVTIGMPTSALAATSSVYVVTNTGTYSVPPPVAGGSYPDSFTTTLPPGAAVSQAKIVRNLTSGVQLAEDLAVVDE